MADTHIILGAGGHAKVLLEVLQLLDANIVGVCDPGLTANETPDWRGMKVLGTDDEVLQWSPEAVLLVNAVGQLPRKSTRFDLHRRWVRYGYRFATLIHPSCIRAKSVDLAEGVQVMAGVVVQPDVRIGESTIINTGVKIDHDCQIGAHVHVAPGAVLCGGVVIEDHTFVGAGAVIGPGIRVGARSVVGANTTVRCDLPKACVFTGAISGKKMMAGRSS